MAALSSLPLPGRARTAEALPPAPDLQILLVEDEAISALALKRLVARLGHEVCA